VVEKVRVLAFVPAYNEGDILPDAVSHLLRQGVCVYVLDNWSSQPLNWMLEDRALSGPSFYYERFPERRPQTYNWTEILHRVEQLARGFEGFDWCMLNDADEIRRSPRPGENLHDAFERVDAMGYNSINFQVLDFPPIDNGYSGDPERYFTRHKPLSGYEGLYHIKAWKNDPSLKLQLAVSGGHYAVLGANQTRLYRHKFISKHYPIRSQQHGERKVFLERKPRWNSGERAKLWHVQYDGIEPGHNFLCDPADLIEYDPKRWETDLP
jgi:Glycosyl transferase family 2